MRKALFAVFATAAMLFFCGPAHRASAMPIASLATAGPAASESGMLQQVHYVGRHRHYGAWHYSYERQYISHRYDCCGFPDGYGYNPGPYWGLGGYLNSWYM
jgi:hypothetical protein